MGTNFNKSLPVETDKPLMTWIRRHPIAAFLVLVLAGSWTAWSLLFLVIEPGGIVHNPPISAYLLAFLGQLWSSICGLLVTWLIYGKAGMQAIGMRLRHWRVGWWWLALLIIPAITAITPLLRWLAGYPVDTGAMAGLLLPGLVLGIVSGFAEEFGWRGFLLPHLLKRYSPLVSTLLLGMVWGGLWHGYADYFGLGDKGFPSWLLLVLLLGPCLLTAWSLIITRVYERTQGSLLISILMHSSLSSTALIFGQSYGSLQEELTWTVINVGSVMFAAILIWIAMRCPKVKGQESTPSLN